MPNRKILLVEDDPDIAEAVAMLLHMEGYHVEIHRTGESVLKLEFELPDLFIVDGNLPDSNGIEIIKHLKTQRSTKDIPVIFYSADRMLIQEVKEMNLAPILEKPFERKQMIAALKNVSSF